MAVYVTAPSTLLVTVNTASPFPSVVALCPSESVTDELATGWSLASTTWTVTVVLPPVSTEASAAVSVPDAGGSATANTVPERSDTDGLLTAVAVKVRHPADAVAAGFTGSHFPGAAAPVAAWNHQSRPLDGAGQVLIVTVAGAFALSTTTSNSGAVDPENGTVPPGVVPAG